MGDVPHKPSRDTEEQVPHSVLRGAERNLSCRGKMEDVAWLSWVVKWQDDGLPRLASS